MMALRRGSRRLATPPGALRRSGTGRPMTGVARSASSSMGRASAGLLRLRLRRWSRLRPDRSLPRPFRLARLASVACAAPGAVGPVVLGAWLVAKQLLWSPSLQAARRWASRASRRARRSRCSSSASRCGFAGARSSSRCSCSTARSPRSPRAPPLPPAVLRARVGRGAHVRVAGAARRRRGPRAVPPRRRAPWADVAALALAAALPAGARPPPRRRGPSNALAVAGVLLFVAPAATAPRSPAHRAAAPRAQPRRGRRRPERRRLPALRRRTFVRRRLDRSGTRLAPGGARLPPRARGAVWSAHRRRSAGATSSSSTSSRCRRSRWAIA